MNFYIIRTAAETVSAWTEVDCSRPPVVKRARNEYYECILIASGTPVRLRNETPEATCLAVRRPGSPP